MKTILRTVFGSHLYGLNTPSSDRDWKEIFIPSLEEILLRGPDQHFCESTGTDDSRNDEKDVDIERMSLTKFVKLACRSEMIAIDMLHSAPHHWEQTSGGWWTLYTHRDVFYTKNMRAYTGYIRKQVAKYGFKGSRLNAIQDAVDALNPFPSETRLEEIWDRLPVDGEYLFKGEMPQANNVVMPYWEVVGKRFISRAAVSTVKPPLVKYEKEYGKRARLAADNEGIDWKAVSHAYRACCQLRALYTRGVFSYPLEETPTILRMKTGGMDWERDAQPLLERAFEEVNKLAENSSFPEQVDKEVVDQLILTVYEQEGLYE